MVECTPLLLLQLLLGRTRLRRRSRPKSQDRGFSVRSSLPLTPCLACRRSDGPAGRPGGCPGRRRVGHHASHERLRAGEPARLDPKGGDGGTGQTRETPRPADHQVPGPDACSARSPEHHDLRQPRADWRRGQKPFMHHGEDLVFQGKSVHNDGSALVRPIGCPRHKASSSEDIGPSDELVPAPLLH